MGGGEKTCQRDVSRVMTSVVARVRHRSKHALGQAGSRLSTKSPGTLAADSSRKYQLAVLRSSFETVNRRMKISAPPKASTR
jgi:hypothetical protein